MAAYGDETVAAWERSVPLGRLGRPEEVAAWGLAEAPPEAGRR